MEAFGSSLIGSWFAFGLYGAATTQSYLYWTHYPRDPLWKKIMVGSLWTLNTMYIACTCIAVYTPLITLGTLPLPRLNHGQAFSVAVLLHAPIITIVMLFYTRIIFLLCSRVLRWWLVGAIGLTIIFSCAFALDLGIRMLITSDHSKIWKYIVSHTIIPAYSLQLAADLFITISLCVLLHNKRTGIRRTSNLINTLIIFSASRGLATLAIVFFVLVMLIVSPGDLWSGIEFVIPGIYINTLMTLLNSRPPTCQFEDSTSIHQSLSGSRDTRRGRNRAARNRMTTIEVEVTALSAMGTTHDNHSQIFQSKVGEHGQEPSGSTNEDV